jgi:methionine-rich copper-binding protein CopC
MAVDKNDIILGSGKLYIVLYNNTMPTDAQVEIDDNNVGRIKGGAKLTYKPTQYEVTDDDNYVVRRIITKEEVTFTSGILTWNLDNLNKLSPATMSTDAVKNEKVLKIGGKTDMDNYLVRFVHTKKSGKKLRVTLLGNAGSGFTFQFNPDKETTYDADFSALSQDDGTLVEFRDEQETASTVLALALSSSTPANNATNVTVGSTITLTFNNAIKDYSDISLLDESDNSLVAFTTLADVTGKIITLTPSSSLTAGKTYDVVLAGVTDIYNQKLAQQIIKFTTAAA